VLLTATWVALLGCQVQTLKPNSKPATVASPQPGAAGSGQWAVVS